MIDMITYIFSSLRSSENALMLSPEPYVNRVISMPSLQFCGRNNCKLDHYAD